MIGSPVSSPRTLAAVLRALSAGRQIRKRKLEKADILELSVKYVKSLQNSVQGRERAWGGGEKELGGVGNLGGVRAMDATRPDKGGMDEEESPGQRAAE